MDDKQCEVKRLRTMTSPSRGLLQRGGYQQQRRGKPFTQLPPFKKRHCSFEECENRASSHDLCGEITSRSEAQGQPLARLNGWKDRVCIEEECGRTAKRRACPMHEMSQPATEYATDIEYA